MRGTPFSAQSSLCPRLPRAAGCPHSTGAQCRPTPSHPPSIRPQQSPLSAGASPNFCDPNHQHRPSHLNSRTVHPSSHGSWDRHQQPPSPVLETCPTCHRAPVAWPSPTRTYHVKSCAAIERRETGLMQAKFFSLYYMKYSLL